MFGRLAEGEPDRTYGNRSGAGEGPWDGLRLTAAATYGADAGTPSKETSWPSPMRHAQPPPC
jgi:hypothetical protein